MTETQQVWDQFSSPIRSFIRRRVHDEHVADDLLQDVFVKIHNRIDSLEDQDRLAAWLYQITRNIITDHYRRRTPSDLETPESVPEDLLNESLTPPNLNDEISQWLVDRIDSLPEDYRSAVSLAELKGMKQADIAEEVGLSLSGTKSRVQRGRKMLKDMLLECCHFEFDRKGNIIDYQRNKQCCQCCENAENGHD